MNKLLIYTLTALTLVLAGCEKEDLPPASSIPSSDPANNVCVISAVMNANNDINASECNGTGQSFYNDSYINTRLANWVAELEHGVSGTKYKILDKGWSPLSKTSCGSSGFYSTQKAEMWIKYDCRGVGVNVKIYGPYPQSALTIKTQEHTAEIQAQGYKIAYVSQDRVGVDSNLFYLTFYVYLPDPNNVVQRSVVASLKDARTFNRVTLSNPNRALGDTLSRAASLDPSMQNRNDYQRARELLDLLDRLRSK